MYWIKECHETDWRNWIVWRRKNSLLIKFIIVPILILTDRSFSFLLIPAFLYDPFMITCIKTFVRSISIRLDIRPWKFATKLQEDIICTYFNITFSDTDKLEYAIWNYVTLFQKVHNIERCIWMFDNSVWYVSWCTTYSDATIVNFC